jgi:glutamate 5-kinase
VKYVAASKTLNRLLDMGVIPIVNENDALSVSANVEFYTLPFVDQC